MRYLFLYKTYFVAFIFLTGCAYHNKVNERSEELTLSNVQRIARVTGSTLPGENLPDLNHTAGKYDVGGTDLGIMWYMGNGKMGIFFGDTYGKDFKPSVKGGGNGNNWRSNVLAFSSDTKLSDGLTIDSMAMDEHGSAREICAGAKARPKPYQTSIPTGAIHANGADYVHYMNIYEWNAPKGRWLTNFSSVYESKDGGNNWHRVEQVTFKSDSKFSQICYAKRKGYVYMIGTLSGRGSPGYLARFKEQHITELNKYEYWNGRSWIRGDESAAIPVINGPVGEASLLYHEKYKRWIITYIYDFLHDPRPIVKKHALVYREAKELTGKWSSLKVITTATEYPGLYSPYMHPLQNDENKLYFTMSEWKPYNVFLMSADIGLD